MGSRGPPRGFTFFWKCEIAIPPVSAGFRVELGETTHPIQKNRPVKNQPPRAVPNGWLIV